MLSTRLPPLPSEVAVARRHLRRKAAGQVIVPALPTVVWVAFHRQARSSSPCPCPSASRRGGLTQQEGEPARSRRPQPPSAKGFGVVSKQPRAPAGKGHDTKEWEAEEELAQGDPANQGPASARPEYQIYTDGQFKPKRFVGSVQAATVEGHGRTLVTTTAVSPGDLLLLLPALSFLEGELFEAPEPEDLQAAMLEDGLTAPLRRVLDLMDDTSGAAAQQQQQQQQQQQASLATLDVKFWSARGNADPSAPAVDAKRLMRVISSCAVTDAQQDTASMQVRQQAPAGFIGLWPEFSLLAHSCVPNTSHVVVGDRMLVHAAGADELPVGTTLTRNCIGPLITAPLAARQAAVLDARGYKCNCPRCTAEASTSESLRQTLEEAASWFSDEAVPQWNACQEAEDVGALRELYQEAEEIVSEVEEAVQSEPGLSEEQRMWMRASAYDSYDMLVMCDEFLNQDASSLSHLRACLELIRVFAPGSESHTAVAVKYDAMTRTRAELAEYVAAKEALGSQQKKTRLSVARRNLSPAAVEAARQAREMKRAAEQASELFLEAFCTRYGLISLQLLELLKEGLEMYTEAMEQMSVMQANGQTEMSTDYMIDGVKFTLTDKLGGVSSGLVEQEPEEDEAEEGAVYLDEGMGGHQMQGARRGEGVVDVEAVTVAAGVSARGSSRGQAVEHANGDDGTEGEEVQEQERTAPVARRRPRGVAQGGSASALRRRSAGGGARRVQD